MGLLDKLFGASERQEEERRLAWVQLVDAQQLDTVESASHERPQLIYKHSTTCGISSMVLGMFTRSFPLEQEEADLYFLDIHSFRPLSNEIVARFGVRHESPQLIILQDGKVVLHRSHGGIADLDLREYL